MKFRNKLLIMPCLALAFGLFASASTLAANEAPKAASKMPNFMFNAAGLGDAGFMACVRSKMKYPGDVNVVANVSAAFDCRSSKN